MCATYWSFVECYFGIKTYFKSYIRTRIQGMCLWDFVVVEGKVCVFNEYNNMMVCARTLMMEKIVLLYLNVNGICKVPYFRDVNLFLFFSQPLLPLFHNKNMFRILYMGKKVIIYIFLKLVFFRKSCILYKYDI